MALVENPTVNAMLADERYIEFLVQLKRILRKDPSFSSRLLTELLLAAARGERVLKFRDQYVVNSWIPPIPSNAFFTFIKGGVSDETLFSDLAHVRRSAPLSAHLCITARCMYHCAHCGATMPDRTAELSTAQWINIFQQLQDLGVAYIGISGGEPLLRDDLEEILSSLDDRSTTLMFTNGYGYSVDRAKSMRDAGLFYSAISVDSPNAEAHNRVRRHPKAFDHAMEAIENSLEAGLYTMLSSVVFRRDLREDYLEDLYRLARERGVHEVRVHQPIPRGELTKSTAAEEIVWTDQDVDRWLDMQEATNRSNDGLKVSSFPYTEGPRKFGCNAGVLHLYISATGDVWPCDFVPLFFGNVVRESLKDIYARMKAATGASYRRCWAKRIAGSLQDRELPLDLQDSMKFCDGCDKTQQFGDFFLTLQQGKMADGGTSTPPLEGVSAGLFREPELVESCFEKWAIRET